MRPTERAWLLALGLILGSTGAALATPAGPASLRPFDERTLGIGESHDYHFTLKQGEYLRIDVEQNDSIDAGIKLFDAGGRLLTESNSYTDTHGAETLSWIAERDEALRVQVYAYGNRAGRYRTSIDGPRKPVAYDRERTLACRAFNEGYRLEQILPNGLFWLAEQSYREAAERWSQLAEPRWTAISRWTLAFTLNRQQRFQEGTRLMREVWPDLVRLEERIPLVEASLHLLAQEGQKGSTLESEQIFLIAARLLPTLHPETTAFFAKDYRQWAWAIGEVGFAALFARYEVTALRASANRDELPEALASLSRLMRRIGRFGEARRAAEQLRRLAESTEEKLQASIALGHCALAVHDPQKALAELRAAEALATTREAEAEVAYYLGWALYEAASYKEAAEQFRRAVVIQESGTLATSLAFLSLAELRLGHLEEAKSTLQRAFTTRRAANLEVEAFLHRVEADIARAEGRWDEARSALSEMLRMLGERRETGIIGASYWSARTDYIEFAVELLLGLAEGKNAERDLERSFLVLEASRAPFLVSMLAEGNGSRTSSDASRIALHQIDDQIAEHQRTRPPGWRRLAMSLQRHREDLLLDASLKEILTTRKSSSRPRPSLDDLRRQLAPGEQLISFLLGQERSYAWLLDHRQLRIEILPAKSVLESMILETVEALEGSREPGRQERAQKASAELSKSLLGALGPFLDGRRLLLNLDGALHRLPFSALTDPVSGEGILLEKFELVVVPSLTMLWITRRDRRPPCSGASVISIDDALISAERDSEAVRRLYPGAQTTGLTKRQLLTGAVQDRCLLHFATHSTAEQRWPDTASLLISRPGGGPPERLYAFEIETLKLKADLVVLASCSSGVGDFRGEGLYGLPRTFLAAGAKGVLASLWKVDGRATAELMNAFYQNLQAGHEPSNALKLAQLSLRARPERAAPAFWAAFQLIGDPQGLK